jgi:hypothetical protein
VLVAGTGLLVAATLVHAGVAMVDVHDKGADDVHVIVPVPAALLDLGAESLPLWLPEAERARLHTRLAPWAPALRAVARELEECPDVTFVEVSSPDGHVRVAKRGRRLTVRVEAPDADVNVSLPAATLSRLLGAIAG